MFVRQVEQMLFMESIRGFPSLYNLTAEHDDLLGDTCHVNIVVYERGDKEGCDLTI